MASMSFWEGVDIPGPALELLILDKLPFPAPNDPWVQALGRYAQQRGENAFERCFLGPARLALQQGAGRLIRHEDDQGILIMTDPRLLRTGYGKQLQKSLPPMVYLPDENALMQRIDSLNKKK